MEKTAEESTSPEGSPAPNGSEMLHVPKAVFIEDVAAYLEGVSSLASHAVVLSFTIFSLHMPCTHCANE